MVEIGYEIRFYVEGKIAESQLKESQRVIKKYSRVNSDSYADGKVSRIGEFVVVNSDGDNLKVVNSTEAARFINNSSGFESGGIELASFLDLYPKEKKQTKVYSLKGIETQNLRKYDGEVSLWFYREKGYVVVSINLSDLDALETSFDGGHINKDNAGFKNQQILISLAEDIFNIFHPVLGVSKPVVIGEDDPAEIEVFDWLKKLEIKHFKYDWYFFGKKYVKKYGKIQLLKIYGAYKINTLKDGGILVALFPANSIRGITKKQREAIERFAAVFGIPLEDTVAYLI